MTTRNDHAPLPTRRQILTGGLAGAAAASMSVVLHADGRTRVPADAADPRLPVRRDRRRVVRFAHLTDVHVQPERGGGEGLAAALQHAQSQRDAPEFIIFGGDNLMNVDSEDGRNRAKVQLDLWNSVLKNECSLPHRHVIGNHDVLGLDPTDGKKWAVDAFGLTDRYCMFDCGCPRTTRETAMDGGRPQGNGEQGAWRFIVLDSTSPEGGGYKGRLDAEQMAWLDETLATTPAGRPVCIVSHIPILAPCSFFDGENEKSGNWQVPGSWMHIDARALKDLFRRHGNVRLCLSGHMHLADLTHYLGVTYACNGAVSGAWWDGAYHEFEPAYALIDLFDDGSSEIELVQFGWQKRD